MASKGPRKAELLKAIKMGGNDPAAQRAFVCAVLRAYADEALIAYIMEGCQNANMSIDPEGSALYLQSFFRLNKTQLHY